MDNTINRLKQTTIVGAIDELANKIHQHSIDKGFLVERNGRYELENVLAEIAKAHSELSEFTQRWRSNDRWGADEHCKDYSNLTIELADTVIWCLSIAKALDMDIANAIIAKHNYNLHRPHKNGKQC